MTQEFLGKQTLTNHVWYTDHFTMKGDGAGELDHGTSK
jgi:hypothetical protein